MTKKERNYFSRKRENLIKEFEINEPSSESDEELAMKIIEFSLQMERTRRGVTLGTADCNVVDSETMSQMKSWDTDDPNMSTIQKVFNRISNARGKEGVELLKNSIIAKDRAISDEQRRKADVPP